MTNTILVDGSWVGSRERHEVRNPADLDEVVGIVDWADTSQVADAVQAAAAALPGWRSSAPEQRANQLHRIADRLLAAGDDLALLLVREQGKTLAEAQGEVARGAAVFRYFAGEAMGPVGEVLAPIAAGAHSVAVRVPTGVISVISPFNFPVYVPCWKIAPALAFGNTVVWKPSELVSLTAAALARIIADGLPPGVVNLVPGGRDVGIAATSHPAVDGITFTGSTAVGRSIAQAVAGSSVGVQLEMGGKNPAIVLDDADPAAVAARIVKGLVAGTGQRCVALSRAIVPAGRHDEYLDRLTAAAATWRFGDGLDPSSMAGPLTSAAALERVEAAVDAACADADVSTVGIAAWDRPGHWCTTTIVSGVDADHPLAVEEVFGPVLTVLTYEDLGEAVAIANATPYGLNASVYGNDLTATMDIVDRLDFGMVQVNAESGVAPHVPFVGVGDSGFGPAEKGGAAREFFTRLRVVNVHRAIGGAR